jgi:hypothetical protein
MPAILVLGRLKQKDCEFKASLGYIARPCLKKRRKREKIMIYSCRKYMQIRELIGNSSNI